MRSPARVILVAFVTLATISTTGHAMASSGRGYQDRRLQAGIDALVARPDGPPGVIAVIQRGDRLHVFSAGVSNLETDRPMRPWMHMRIASTAKAYSGGVALSLVSRGVMSLDDTVGELLPWTNQDWHRVTLAQALRHTSGIPDFTGSDEFIEAVIASPDVAPPPRELLSYVEDDDLRFDPETEYEYSNSDNIVVALMVKAATAQRYERSLARLVAGPLRLRRTTLPRGVAMARPFVHGYQWADDDPPEDVTHFLAGGWAWASGGIVSTPIDQTRFIRGYVGRRLFDAGIQDAQFDFVEGGSEPTGPGHNRAGFAIFRYSTRCGVVFGHTGNTFGFTQFFAATRSGRRSAVVSVNRQITQTSSPDLYADLRDVFERAVCASLA
jgi:D-alanyl-D-alanine carboxypeptidase